MPFTDLIGYSRLKHHETVIRHLYLLQLLQSFLQLLLQSLILRAQLNAPFFVSTHYFFALLQKVFLSLDSLLQSLHKFSWITVALSWPQNIMQQLLKKKQNMLANFFSNMNAIDEDMTKNISLPSVDSGSSPCSFEGLCVEDSAAFSAWLTSPSGCTAPSETPFIRFFNSATCGKM